MAKKNQKETAIIDQSLIDASKSLFANICFTKVDNDIKTICVTSSYASEGKSTTSLNLAIAIAQSGKKTLLVENDMRKRTLSAALKLSGEHDICDLIRGNVQIMDAVIPTDYDNLYFLDVAPGVPSPSDILGSERYTKLIGRLKERFDYVIIDTPPILLFVDAAIVSSIADGTILVVKESSTKKSAAAKALSQLQKANANIIGISMSYCQVRKDDYYYYSYYSAETGEKIGRSSGSSGKVDLSEIERMDKPVWDVDYDENEEKFPGEDATRKGIETKIDTPSDKEECKDASSGSGEDLESITINQLRKRAKELGINVSGLKKADIVNAILDMTEPPNADAEVEVGNDNESDDPAPSASQMKKGKRQNSPGE